MNKIFKLQSALLMCMMLMLPAVTTSCNDDDDDFDTNQYHGGVALNVFGPSPVARGGELRFLGSGMDQINAVVLPGCGDVTDITVVNSGEIRITVPQNAEPGYVILRHANGEIKTKTLLTYLEPVSIDAFDPATVKPGSTLTIKGEYLNLMREVCFSFAGSDSANVYMADFIKHDRKEIQVVVPVTAVSGPVAVSDAQAEIPNMIWSEVELNVVLPSVDKVIDLTGAKPGQAVEIVGKDFDLVTSMSLLPVGEHSEPIAIDYSYDAEKGSVTFNLPDNACDGTAVVTTASAVNVPVARIGVVVPTDMEATPATEIRPGDLITVKGVNMDMVASISLPNVADPVAPKSVTSTELTFVWAQEAQSGDAVLNLRSGASVALALSTAKPDVQAFDPAEVPAGSDVTLKGKNLDLIVSVVFGGGVKVDAKGGTATELTLAAPITAQSGQLTLNMANGESVTTAPLTLLLPEGAYVTEVLTEEPKAGEIFKLQLGNPDKLTDVKVNDAAVQYINNGGILYISLPASCGANTKVTLISGSSELTYTYDVIPATHVEKVLMNEIRNLGSWAGESDGGAFRLYKEQFDGVPAGAKLVFHIAPFSSNVQIQLNDANWGQMEMLKPSQDATTAEWVLTADNLNRILTTNDGWSTTAMVIQGEGTIVSKVTAEWENELGDVVFEGPLNLTWGDEGRFGIALNYFENLKPGSTMEIYYTQNDNWGQVQLNNGGWSNVNFPEIGGAYLNTDNCGGKDVTMTVLTFTEETLASILANPSDYFGMNTNTNGDTRVGMIIQGSDWCINKIVFKK